MDKITWKHFKNNLLAQPFFVWHKLEDQEEEDFDSLNFYFQDLDFVETSVANVIGKTFGKVTEKANEMLQKQGAETLSGTIEERIEKTKMILNSDKFVINPAFEYKDTIAEPLAFDFKNKIAYGIKFSKKTKRLDFMKCYFEISIIGKNNVKVEDYQLIIPVDAEGLKGEINLTSINYINLGKSGKAYSEMKDFKSIVEVYKDGSDDFILKGIDLYINEIKKARDVTEISKNLDKDVTDFGSNPQWHELLSALNHEYSGVNGHVVKKESIVKNEVKEEPALAAYKKIDRTTILNAKEVDNLISKIESSSKIVWYDFEGFSTPFPVIDHTKPYQQIVYQLSKIITDGKLFELEKQNLIWDPKNISTNDLFDVIKEVYANKADYYVVYNQGYENARLREIVRLLSSSPLKDEATAMQKYIEEHTIDLWELFKISGANKTPSILLHDQKMKSSIKNIEKHISANHIDVGYKIKEYKNLDVKNGAMAMQVAIERAIGLIGDKEWNHKTIHLKEYCENDVKMMIMTYYFIKHLVNEDRTEN